MHFKFGNNNSSLLKFVVVVFLNWFPLKTVIVTHPETQPKHDKKYVNEFLYDSICHYYRWRVSKHTQTRNIFF